MPAAAAATKGSIRVHDHVTQFGAHAMKTLQQTAICDDASADARADRNIDHILVPLPGAKLPFRQPRHVCIVIEVGRYAEVLRKSGCEREICPLGDIRRGKDGACMRIKRTRRGDPDRTHGTFRPYSFDRLC